MTADDVPAGDAKTLASAEGFSAFVARQAQFAYRVAYALLRNSSDAEDAVQETMLKLYRNGGWQAAENERAYLARAVWRMASGLAAQRQRRDAPLAHELLLEPVHAGPGPEQKLLERDAHEQVHRLIDALPEKLRQPLVLVSIEEMSGAEVSAVLGLPEGTVRRRVMEARTILRDKLRALEVRRGR